MKKEMLVKPAIVELEKMIQNHNVYFIDPKAYLFRFSKFMVIS